MSSVNSFTGGVGAALCAGAALLPALVFVVTAIATVARDARRGRHDALEPCSEARLTDGGSGARSLDGATTVDGDRAGAAIDAGPSTGAVSADAVVCAGATSVLSAEDAGRPGWPTVERRARGSRAAIDDDDDDGGGASRRW